MTTPVCTHGMPTPAACVECMEEGVFPPAPPPPTTAGAERSGPDIEARYDGHCRGCNTAVHVGELICRTTHGTYEHASHHPVTAGRWSVGT